MSEVIATPQKIGISVLFDVVRVEFMSRDAYAAQVLYDDLAGRLRGRRRFDTFGPAATKKEDVDGNG